MATAKEKLYVAYDARAHYMDEDDCSVLVATDSLGEAKATCKEYGGGVVFEYELKGKEAINGKAVAWI